MRETSAKQQRKKQVYISLAIIAVMVSLFGLSRVLEIELYDFDYTPIEVVATPAPTPTPPPPPAGLYEVELPIIRGAHGEDVMRLQGYLNEISYFHPDNIPTLQVDGNFGPRTEGAVIDFQTLAGLEPDGIVDFDTWYTLLRVRESPENLG